MRKLAGLLVYACVTLGAATLIAAPERADDTRPAAAAVEEASLLATGLSDEAAMMLAGTALIGVAAAVRRAA